MKNKLIQVGICLVLVLIFVSYSFSWVYSDGTYSELGTGDAVDGSADAITWTQAPLWTIDKYGKYIWLTQERSGPTSHWAWSNNDGTSWEQGSESYGFLTRGSVAYDSNNDKLHVLWSATDSSDGIIYRRYGITRDGSNNITAISREDASNINLQLDTSSSCSFEHPSARWVDDGSPNGILIAVWSKGSCSGIAQVRGSMRKLSLSAADGVANNWEALDGNADSFVSESPAVDADIIHNGTSGNNGNSVRIRGGSGSRKDDLYVFVQEHNSGGTDSVFAYRAIWDSGEANWSGGWQSPITVGDAFSENGYNLKWQLISNIVYDDNNDRLYVGWARWKDNTAGDTVSIAYLDSTDNPSATIDVYSANGIHSYAPTLGLAYDSTLDDVYIAYIDSTTNGDNGSIFYKIYNGTTLSGETVLYTSPGGSAGANGGADIPVLYESRVNDRLLFGFRINGDLPPTSENPHTINWGYIALSTPTPTPTVTPTLSPTNTPTPTVTPVVQSQSSGTTRSNTTGTPVCSEVAPSGVPSLFQIDANSTGAKLFFAPLSSGVTSYYVAFGITPDDERYGIEIPYGASTGVLSYTLNHLSPNTAYYVRIRANNGCMTGNWSNEMMFVTQKINSKQSARYYKNLVTKIASYLPVNTTPFGVPATCEYTVKKGDSLWRIAQNFFGNGSSYSQLIQKNNLSSSILRVGQTIKLGC